MYMLSPSLSSRLPLTAFPSPNMITTRDITLNGIKASIAINTQLNSSNQMNWTMTLTDTKSNVTSTGGLLNITLTSVVTSEIKPVVKPNWYDEKYLPNTEEVQEENRIILMRSIFTKKGRTFDDTVMPRYHEWEKTYKPQGTTNRYKKMMAFVNTLA